VAIPDGNDHSRAQFAPLVSQLRAWRATIPTKLLTQDAVMALWFVWLDWMETQRALRAGARSWNVRRKLPWRPTRAPVLLKGPEVGV
jgi:hypothetical protein